MGRNSTTSVCATHRSTARERERETPFVHVGIEFEDGQQTFLAGSTIKGTIFVVAEEGEEGGTVDRVTLVVQGRGTNEWLDEHTDYLYETTTSYVDTKLIVPQRQGEELLGGRSTFEFATELPNDLPSTMTFDHGRVEYTMRATLNVKYGHETADGHHEVVSPPYVINVIANVALLVESDDMTANGRAGDSTQNSAVNTPLPIADATTNCGRHTPHRLLHEHSVAISDEFIYRLWCAPIGCVMLDMTLTEGSAACGGVLQITGNIRNSSKTRVSRPHLQLVQCLTFIAGRRMIESSSTTRQLDMIERRAQMVIVSRPLPEVPHGHELAINTLRMKLGALLPTFTNSHMRVSYVVRLIGQRDIECDVPLEIAAYATTKEKIDELGQSPIAREYNTIIPTIQLLSVNGQNEAVFPMSKSCARHRKSATDMMASSSLLCDHHRHSLRPPDHVDMGYGPPTRGLADFVDDASSSVCLSSISSSSTSFSSSPFAKLSVHRGRRHREDWRSESSPPSNSTVTLEGGS